MAIVDHGRLVVSGTVDELATKGARRLAIRIEGDRQGAWAQTIPGVTVSEIQGGEIRLILEDSAESDVVLDAARTAGRVTKFVFERRRLSEVFREAVSR